MKVPSMLMHVLGGEARLNDASGLVCLRVAIAAAATGVFSWTAAARSLVIVSIGGVAIGAGVAWLFARAQLLIFRRRHEASDARMLLIITLPYAAYLAGEHAHVSGILAAAGMVRCAPSLQRQPSTRKRRGVDDGLYRELMHEIDANEEASLARGDRSGQGQPLLSFRLTFVG